MPLTFALPSMMDSRRLVYQTNDTMSSPDRANDPSSSENTYSSEGNGSPARRRSPSMVNRYSSMHNFTLNLSCHIFCSDSSVNPVTVPSRNFASLSPPPCHTSCATGHVAPRSVWGKSCSTSHARRHTPHQPDLTKNGCGRATCGAPPTAT